MLALRVGHGLPCPDRRRQLYRVAVIFRVKVIRIFRNRRKEKPGSKPATVLNELRKRVIHALQSREKDTSLQDGMDIAIIHINFKEKKLTAKPIHK